jgi:hypothetical protein
MDTAKHQDIAARAYAIWEQEGRPDGRSIEHWHRAERELSTVDRDPPAAGSGARAARSATDTPTRPTARKPTLATRRGRRVPQEMN